MASRVPERPRDEGCAVHHAECCSSSTGSTSRRRRSCSDPATVSAEDSATVTSVPPIVVVHANWWYARQLLLFTPIGGIHAQLLPFTPATVEKVVEHFLNNEETATTTHETMAAAMQVDPMQRIARWIAPKCTPTPRRCFALATTRTCRRGGLPPFPLRAGISRVPRARAGGSER